MPHPNISALNIATRGGYDLQKLRMQIGLRLVANFRAKLTDEPAAESEEDPDAPDEMSAEAEKLIDRLRSSYRRLTDGVAKNRTLPKEEGFQGDELISTFAELVLVDQYIRLERQEELAFRQLMSLLEPIPIYAEYLAHQVGVGPAMAAVLVSILDPHKARHVSSFWAYSGIDVGPDGRGRSRRAEHLVERSYINKAGKPASRQGVTYNPFLKTKLTGVLAGSFLRSGSPWRKAYDDYRHRLETDPAREKVTSAVWKKRYAAGEEVGHLWTPGRINNAAKRYMVKQFLAELWLKWRELEGLPITPTYHEWRRGYGHGKPPVAAA
jgi:hypothetical protein